MCGRFTLTVPTFEDLAEVLGVDVAPDAAQVPYRPRFNVAPTDPSWIVRMNHGVRELMSASWGLIPRWSTHARQAGRPINARAETLATTPTFRDSVARGRRCVVVTDGFFEWEKVGKERLPFWFRPANDERLLLMAGVWDSWFDKEAEAKKTSFSIVTTRASSDVTFLHHRMPVLLRDDDALAAWLDASPGLPEAASALFQPSPPGTLVPLRVSTRVNSVKNDDEACVAPPTPEEIEARIAAASAAPKKRGRR